MESLFIKEVTELFYQYRYVLIYGAGGVTEDFLLLLEPYLGDKETGKCQPCVVVSDKKENQDFLKGYPVKEISEFYEVRDEAYIIISTMPRYMVQIEEHLNEMGFHNYCRVSSLIDRMYEEIWMNSPVNNKVVFSNGDGYGFGGNPKYIALELLSRRTGSAQGIDLVWITNDCSRKLPEGVRAVKYGSYEHYYELGTAQVWIDNQHKNFFSRKRAGQIYIQTWHGGGPLKKIEFDAEGLSDSYLDLCELNSEMEDIMVSPSKFNSQLYRRAFHYQGQVMECGYPRNDIFWTDNGCRKKIERLYHIKPEEGIVLFAPTYREADVEEALISHSGFSAESQGDYDSNRKNILDLNRVQQALEFKTGKKFKVLVRFHPYDRNPERRYVWYEEWENVTDYDDVQELLAASDILITDYSSIMWDFSIQGKPVFLFHPDLDRYEKERGYYLAFDQMPYIEAFSNEELYKKIKQFDEVCYRKKLTRFLAEYGSFDRGTASKVIADTIMEMIKNRNYLRR